MDWEGLTKEEIQLGLPLLIVKGSKGFLGCGYITKLSASSARYLRRSYFLFILLFLRLSTVSALVCCSKAARIMSRRATRRVKPVALWPG
jgi:hypothetical protein